MATSCTSSDENSIAQEDLQLSSSSDSSCPISNIKQKCSLCGKQKKCFYCRDCIHRGLFYSSNTKEVETRIERYIDKYRVLLDVSDHRKLLEKKCLIILDAKQKTDILYSRIRQVKERNKILNISVGEISQKNALNITKLKDLRDENEKIEKQLLKYDHKIQQLEYYVSGRRYKVEKAHKNSEERQNEVRKLVKVRIQQLFKFIFPISKIKPVVEIESSSDDMVSALADASQTTYIRDRWEYTDYSGEMQYCIVAPTLPSSGNYSAYNLWVAQNQDAPPGSNTALTLEHNPAFSISAALTYTAQLVHILSFYLNVRLPFKMFYSDFCCNDMSEQQFVRRVARLNANILYLCFSQNVNLCSLNSTETIANILQLIEDNSSDLGRQGPIEVDQHQASILELPLSNDLKITDTSDSEEGDSFTIEWEAVPHCPEAQAGPAASHSPQMINTQQASSMAGGLVNSAAASIASIWRGFTQGR